MIDQPELFIPHQHIGIVRCAVNIRQQGSSHTIAEASFSSTGVTSGSKLMAPEGNGGQDSVPHWL
jgi:hypothetical protein